MSAWKVADSLEELRHQLDVLAPRRSKASDGSIGDAAHAGRDSDHNPWWVFLGQAYVTARDFTHDPAGGLDCAWLAERLCAQQDQRVKYLIYRQRIMAGRLGPSPWVWRPYGGTNPHEKHLHLSVVPDARSLVRIPWRLDEPTGPLPVAPRLEDPDLSPEEHAWLQRVHHELTLFLPDRRGPRGETTGAKDTVLGYAANADGFGVRASWALDEIQGQVTDLTRAVQAQALQAGPVALDYDQLAAALLRAFVAGPANPEGLPR